MSALLVEPRERFGQAKVAFGVDTPWGRPAREGAQISFPFAFDEISMYELMNGQQFLIVPGDGRRPYFGGTDEAPFMVQLESVHLANFVRGGEATFYDGLKPTKIKNYEEIFGGEALRQGDIWALALPMGWDELRAYYRKSTGEQRGLKISEGSRSILKTRHVITGKWAKDRPRAPLQEAGSYKYTRRYLSIRDDVVEGIMTAPDHAPLKLDGPHVLTRTAGIAIPTWYMPE